MEIEIKELVSFEQFSEVSELQNKIWGLKDRDIISTISLRAYTMDYPLMGLLLGAYYNKKMVGFVICLPTREPQTLYGLIMGVLPECQNSEVGYKLGLKVLEKCNQQNVTKICWTFEPLDSLLGHLYLNKWGSVVIKYEQNYYQLEDEVNKDLPLDRFVADCNLQSPRVITRVNNIVKNNNLAEAIANYHIADGQHFSDEKSVLVKIPSDFQKLKNTNLAEAIKFRMNTRAIFEEYINKRSYFIAEMFTDIVNGERQNYYLLEKRNYI
jgi:predicted GNAT superfamily acetyltransferase